MFTCGKIWKSVIIILSNTVELTGTLCVSGGAAEQSGLQSGDELLQVQGVSLQDMTRFEAWNMIKALPEGSVTVVIRKRQEDVE